MRLSIIIVNWNTTSLLCGCLNSIEMHPPSMAYEVIVVDNASTDIDPTLVAQAHPAVRLIANVRNEGYARGNNQGLDVAAGDYVLLLNPDTEVTDGALDALVEFMQNHPNAGAAGAKMVRPDGRVDRSVRSFPYPGAIAWEFVGFSRLFPNNRRFGAYRMTCFGYDTAAEVDQPMASCLIVSRRALDVIGKMDESFPIFFNDVDWLYQARECGFTTYFTPDAVVIHHGAGSTRQRPRREMQIESHDSLLRFYRKHFRGRISPFAYFFTVVCISMSRALRTAPNPFTIRRGMEDR